MERIKPASWAQAGIVIHRNFNDNLYVDVLSILTSTERCLVLSPVDSATRFLAARLIRSESTLDVIHAIERGWIRQFGAMKRLTCDEGRGFCSDEFKAWCERHGVALRVAPGEAHNRFGSVERRHAVLRESIEHYVASCDQARGALFGAPGGGARVGARPDQQPCVHPRLHPKPMGLGLPTDPIIDCQMSTSLIDAVGPAVPPQSGNPVHTFLVD